MSPRSLIIFNPKTCIRMYSCVFFLSSADRWRYWAKNTKFHHTLMTNPLKRSLTTSHTFAKLRATFSWALCPLCSNTNNSACEHRAGTHTHTAPHSCVQRFGRTNCHADFDRTNCFADF